MMAARVRATAGTRTGFATLGLLCALVVPSAADERHVVRGSDGRSITVTVPTGWSYEESEDPKLGIPTIEIRPTKSDVQLDVSFLPDPDGKLSTRAALEAKMRQTFATYTADAVEKEMVFTDLGSSAGAGAFTVFTDRRLVGRKIPEGERLISTTGMQSWKGGYLLFTLLSNSRESEEYRRALEVVRSGIAAGPAAPSSSSSSTPGEAFTVAAAPWVLRVADPGMEVTVRKVKPDGSSAYYMMHNEKTGMNLSFFIEPAVKCKTSRECRDMIQKAGFAHVGKVENVEASEVGDVSVVEYFLPKIGDAPVRQQNLNAEFVVDGYWVDAHLSKAVYTPADHGLFLDAVRSLRFEPKK